MKRKGESPRAGTRPMKKLKATPPEFGLPEEEPEAHDAVPERLEEVSASSEEGEDAELATQKEKAARAAVTKERRSKTKHDLAPKEAARDVTTAAGTSSTPRVDTAPQELVATQSPLPEVVDAQKNKALVEPSGLGQFPLPSAGFPELYWQLGAAYEVRVQPPEYA